MLSFNEIVNVIIKKMETEDSLPDRWNKLKLVCCYVDDVMELNAYYKISTVDMWASYPLYISGVELLDLFEELAELTHDKNKDCWTKLSIIRTIEGDYSYEYGYGDPGIFN